MSDAFSISIGVYQVMWERVPITYEPVNMRVQNMVTGVIVHIPGRMIDSMHPGDSGAWYGSIGDLDFIHCTPTNEDWPNRIEIHESCEATEHDARELKNTEAERICARILARLF